MILEEQSLFPKVASMFEKSGTKLIWQNFFTKSVPIYLNPLYLVDFSIVICWTSPFVILGVLGLFYCLSSIVLWKILLLLANNVDPDQMPHYVASDLGLHCLPLTFLWVSG